MSIVAPIERNEFVVSPRATPDHTLDSFGMASNTCTASSAVPESFQFSVSLVDAAARQLTFLKAVHTCGESLATPSREKFERYVTRWLPLVATLTDGASLSARVTVGVVLSYMYPRPLRCNKMPYLLKPCVWAMNTTPPVVS